jgi:hypothetical protein
VQKQRSSQGYFSFELALTAAITLPFVLGIFDVMRYIIVHSILKNATARVVRAEKQVEGKVKPLASQVAEDISYLITVRGIACNSTPPVPTPCCLENEVGCLKETRSLIESDQWVTFSYHTEYVILDKLFAQYHDNPVFRGLIMHSRMLWVSTPLPLPSRFVNSVAED